jgi:hypothetical protein
MLQTTHSLSELTELLNYPETPHGCETPHECETPNECETPR